MTKVERIMVQSHVNAALFLRRRALHSLRIGDRFEHRSIMQLTRLPLKQARAWKVKP